MSSTTKQQKPQITQISQMAASGIERHLRNRRNLWLLFPVVLQPATRHSGRERRAKALEQQNKKDEEPQITQISQMGAIGIDRVQRHLRNRRNLWLLFSLDLAELRTLSGRSLRTP
jgi:hypothetical protein